MRPTILARTVSALAIATGNQHQLAVHVRSKAVDRRQRSAHSAHRPFTERAAGQTERESERQHRSESQVGSSATGGREASYQKAHPVL